MYTHKNFIDSYNLNIINEVLKSRDIPWYHYQRTVEKEDEILSSIIVKNTPNFRHSFIHEQKTVSNFINVINPILKNIKTLFSKDLEFYSCHANLLPPNKLLSNKYTYPHIDVDYDIQTRQIADCYTGIFYLDNSDGNTIVWRNKNSNDLPYYNISPEANKFVFWNSDLIHSAPAGPSTTRVVLNFNFCVKK